MKRLLASIALLSLFYVGNLSAQQAPTKPKEIEALSQYVGNWTSDVTNKPAVWDQNGTKFKTLNQAEMVLDGWFLHHIQVNHIDGEPDKATNQPKSFLERVEITSKVGEPWECFPKGNTPVKG